MGKTRLVKTLYRIFLTVPIPVFLCKNGPFPTPHATMTAPEPAAGSTFVEPHQLRPGLYVILDLPWFKHNFTLNQFKVRSEQQVRELRELRLERYRIDPSRSDAEAMASVVAHSHQEEPVAPVLPAASTEPPEVQARRQRREALAQRQQHIANVERAFSKATSTMKNLNRNLLAKPVETLGEMGALVGRWWKPFWYAQRPRCTSWATRSVVKRCITTASTSAFLP